MSRFYSYGDYQFLLCKPFADYTFVGSAEGADENATTFWEYWLRDERYTSDGFGEWEITYAPYLSVDDAPYFYVIDGDPMDEDTPFFGYQMKNYTMSGDDNNPVIDNETPVQVLSVVNSEMYDDDMELPHSTALSLMATTSAVGGSVRTVSTSTVWHRPLRSRLALTCSRTFTCSAVLTWLLPRT